MSAAGGRGKNQDFHSNQKPLKSLNVEIFKIITDAGQRAEYQAENQADQYIRNSPAGAPDKADSIIRPVFK